ARKPLASGRPSSGGMRHHAFLPPSWPCDERSFLNSARKSRSERAVKRPSGTRRMRRGWPPSSSNGASSKNGSPSARRGYMRRSSRSRMPMGNRDLVDRMRTAAAAILAAIGEGELSLLQRDAADLLVEASNLLLEPELEQL